MFVIVLILEHSPANFSLVLMSLIICIFSVVQFSLLAVGVFDVFVSHPPAKTTRKDVVSVVAMFFEMLIWKFQED